MRDLVCRILNRLREAHTTIPWNWHTQQPPFQVLIGTVLSQRTRDEKTDEAARNLFARYPDVHSLASAPVEEVAELIRPANYYRTKAQRILDICRELLDRFGGEVPDDTRTLMTLPGVGLKTASCVMVYGFHKPAIPVDTHVHRICNRIGLIATRTPKETEAALWDLVPAREVLWVNELLVKHGQAICGPQHPRCDRCPIDDLCGFPSKRRAPGKGPDGEA